MLGKMVEVHNIYLWMDINSKAYYKTHHDFRMVNFNPEMAGNPRQKIFGSRTFSDGQIFSSSTPMSLSFHEAPKVSLPQRSILSDKKVVLISRNRVPRSVNLVNLENIS